MAHFPIVANSGGTITLRVTSRLMLGLSPRVRGNLSDAEVPAVRVGSIPACAGEPCRLSRSFCRKRVYPRVCGGTLSSVLGAVRGRVYPRVCGGTEATLEVAFDQKGLSRVCGGTRD